jgi:hypothetical protein
MVRQDKVVDTENNNEQNLKRMAVMDLPSLEWLILLRDRCDAV